jgi:hypothetical protein
MRSAGSGRRKSWRMARHEILLALSQKLQPQAARCAIASADASGRPDRVPRLRMANWRYDGDVCTGIYGKVTQAAGNGRGRRNSAPFLASLVVSKPGPGTPAEFSSAGAHWAEDWQTTKVIHQREVASAIAKRLNPPSDAAHEPGCLYHMIRRRFQQGRWVSDGWPMRREYSMVNQSDRSGRISKGSPCAIPRKMPASKENR